MFEGDERHDGTCLGNGRLRRLVRLREACEGRGRKPDEGHTQTCHHQWQSESAVVGHGVACGACARAVGANRFV
jgi:hypothetical protein